MANTNPDQNVFQSTAIEFSYRNVSFATNNNKSCIRCFHILIHRLIDYMISTCTVCRFATTGVDMYSVTV